MAAIGHLRKFAGGNYRVGNGRSRGTTDVAADSIVATRNSRKPTR